MIVLTDIFLDVDPIPTTQFGNDQRRNEETGTKVSTDQYIRIHYLKI
jgi:hypothetical protein